MHASLSLNPRYDELVVSLKQIDALLDVATSADITELKSETITNYFYILSDILRKASITCEDLADVETYQQTDVEENNKDN